MNTLLITPAEVLELAFPSNEYIPDEFILPLRIETAQLQFLRPVFGALYDLLTEVRYADFTEVYIKPALAYYVRLLLVDERCASIGTMGVVSSKMSYAASATDTQVGRLRKQARNDAETLLQKAVDYVETHPEQFPSYDPCKNIRRQIAMKGGFVIP